MAVQIKPLDFLQGFYQTGMTASIHVFETVANLFKRKAEEDVDERPRKITNRQLTQEVLIICNGSVQLVDRNALPPFFDAKASKITIELGVSIGSGTYGTVYKGVIRTPEKVDPVDIAVKTSTSEDVGSKLLLRESILNSLAAMAPNVAGGAFLLEILDQSYLIQKLFSCDGHVFTFSPAKMITQENTISIFGDVLRGGQGLVERGIYHFDLKPENVLVDSSGNLHLSDLGGAFYLPPIDQITDELLIKQLELLTENDKVSIKHLLDKLDHLEFHEKLFIFLYCQSGGALKIYPTKYTSNNSLEIKINSKLNEFFTELEKTTNDQNQIIENYNQLRSLLENLMVYQMAVTTLAMLTREGFVDIVKNRGKGEFTGTGVDPLSQPGVIHILYQAKVTDSRVSQLFLKMLNSENSPITTEQCLRSFSRFRLRNSSK